MKNYKCIVFLILLTMISQPLFSQIIYEAEKAELTSGAFMKSNEKSSGGAVASGIGGEKNGMVIFSKISVAKTGLYPMTVSYFINDDRSFTIRANQEAIPQELIFLNNAAHNEVSSKIVLIPLNAGDNSIEFSNADEGSPDVDKITIAEEPVQSFAISGTISSENSGSLAGINVRLSGQINRATKTDKNGRYEFNYLPSGSYEIKPMLSGNAFAPYSKLVSIVNSNSDHQNFSKSAFSSSKNIELMKSGKWQVEYNLDNGTACIFNNDHLLIADAFAVVKVPEAISSIDLKSRKVEKQTVHDEIGNGLKYEVKSSGEDGTTMIQTFCFYENADFFVMDVSLQGKEVIHSNYVAPLISNSESTFLPKGDNRALFVPFDNDKWIRYDAYPFGKELTSYEVSAFYNNDNRNGLVIGSVTHDQWKSGVKSTTIENKLTGLEVFGGITSNKTRDVLSHGSISGKEIHSPKIMIGFFDDWRLGLETFAKVNSAITPARTWSKGTPFGWNSWGKLKFSLNFDKAIQVSDFFADKLQPNNFQNDSVVYIGLDSGWNKMTDEQLRLFVDHCKSNHQEAGVYFGPFTAWGNNDEKTVEGSDYKYTDIYLYANQKIQKIDGGVAVDPTHPATKKRMAYYAERFKKAGFKFLKIDFLVHGALEADHYYDSNVTTGIQAYNEGMSYLKEVIGDEMYINAAISPLFPAQYVHSRRIGCDAWGDITLTEYALNSLTFGWWLDRVYKYNDADHVVLGDYSEGENRIRVSSSVITGIYILGDDFSTDGSPIGKARAEKYATNPEINAIAKFGKSFRPVEGNTGNNASNLFMYENADYLYLAIFNYSEIPQTTSINFSRLGIKNTKQISATELWSGNTTLMRDMMKVTVGAKDMVFYKLTVH